MKIKTKKLIGISEEVHKKLKCFCAKNELSIKEAVEKSVELFIESFNKKKSS